MDITETKESQEKIHYLSTHDPVTGLYNRQFISRNQEDRYGYKPSHLYNLRRRNGLKLLNISGHDKGMNY